MLLGAIAYHCLLMPLSTFPISWRLPVHVSQLYHRNRILTGEGKAALGMIGMMTGGIPTPQDPIRCSSLNGIAGAGLSTAPPDGRICILLVLHTWEIRVPDYPGA